MNSRRLAIGLSALAALAFVVGTAKAGDTVRLSLPGGDSAPTHNLKATPDDLAADTVATRGVVRGVARGVGFVAHRGYYGGYRGFYGGYRGYYGGYRGLGHYGGYRGLGYYGGYRGLGYYGPRFYGAYYGGYYPSYVYPSYVYPSYTYPLYSGYYPITDNGTAVATQTTVIRSAAPSNYERPLPMPYADDELQPAPGQPGTYPYDGGPQLRVPMPSADESPVRYPNRDKPAIVEDIVVNLPAKSGKWTYPAYGEKPSR